MQKQKSWKSFWVTSLFAAMLVWFISIPTASFAAKVEFPDVSTSHPYYEAINDLAEAEIIKGFPDGEFKLKTSLTRAEASKMISEIKDLPLASSQAPFKDIKQNVWYTAAINSLYDAGHISGYDQHTFKPNLSITRAEFSEIIVNAYGLSIKESVEVPFQDVKKGAWYESAIQTLYTNGLIKGINESTFAPNDKINRGDAAWLLANTDYLFGSKLKDQNYQLSLMHTSDTHGHLDQIAKRVTAVNNFRADYPNALLIDSGDVFSGTLYFNEYRGLADIVFMNLMKYDVMTFGNHEFDLGTEGNNLALKEFVSAAEFPFVSSNVDFSKDADLSKLFLNETTETPEKGKIYNGIVKEIDGEKVGIFGLTTEDTINISSPVNIQFNNYIEAAKKAVTTFKAQGINKIVAVTHIGYDDNKEIDNDLELVAWVDGIDVILGGHSHTRLDEAVLITKDAEGNEKDPTLISHTYQYGDFLGTINVEFDDNGVIVGQASKLISIADQEADVEATAILKEYSDKVEEIMTQESGGVAVQALDNPRSGGDNTKPSVRRNETPLGNLITDGMLKKAREFDPDVMMALQNGGGIRTSIDEGPITIGEIMKVLPFGNTLALMDISGAELKQAFEVSLGQYPNENGGFLHVSGAKVTFDSSKPAGERVISIQYRNVNGNLEEINNEVTYTIATNAFTAKGGDGYDMFAKAYEEGRVTDLGLSDWENLRDHIKELGNVNPQVEGRIVDTAS